MLQECRGKGASGHGAVDVYSSTGNRYPGNVEVPSYLDNDDGYVTKFVITVEHLVKFDMNTNEYVYQIEYDNHTFTLTVSNVEAKTKNRIMDLAAF